MKLSEIIVMPKAAVPFFQCDVPWAIIQIATDENDWPEHQTENCISSLKLLFPDADAPRPSLGETFDYRNADSIINFVDGLKDRIDKLVIHCHAGISRSPGVAGALSKYYFKDDSKFFTAPYCPNMLVYRTLLVALMEKAQ